MSDKTQHYMHKFWELIDVILNSFLFILIALVLVVMDFSAVNIALGLISIVIVLLSRFIVVSLPRLLLPKTINLDKKEARVIIWGGLRGGLSIALVLSLPDSGPKNILLMATYTCVLFSILVQGLTIGRLAKQQSVGQP